MTRTGQVIVGSLAVLAGQLFISQKAVCQLTSNLAPSAQTKTNLAAQLAVPNPVLKSPVALFRELLAMDPEERQKALAKRTPEGRKRLMAKLREYQSLRPDQRELRLRATELSWYLQPLMHVPPTNRPPMLEQIPPELRATVESRLLEWDLLPPPFQSEVLTNEIAIRYFGGSEASISNLTHMSVDRKAKLEAGIAQWRSLPESQRQQILDRFNHFFELRPADQKKALNTLSDAERNQMEKTLRSYENLTTEQREQCLRSFEKFAEMSLPERQQFLKNADRWKIMSPTERQTWRELVRQMPYTPNDSVLPHRTSVRPETALTTNH